MGFFLRGGLGLAAFFASAVWFCGCSNPGLDGTAVCGTEVQDPFEVAGCVEHKNGGTAIGVRVTAIRKGGGLLKEVSTADSVTVQAGPEIETRTDEDGLYTFRNLPKGEYTLFFDYLDESNPANSQGHREENVLVVPNSRYSQGKTTLKPTATLNATAFNLVDNNGVEGAVCQLEYTPYRETTRGSGSFLLYAVPGKYHVVCEKGELKSQPYEVTLEPGRVADPRIPMSVGGQRIVAIPVPANVNAVLDTVNGIVRVSWTNPISSETLEYWVKRNEMAGSTPSKSWMVASGDSVFNDPVFAGEQETVLSKTVQYSVYCSRPATKENGKYVLSKIVNAVRGPVIESGFLDSARTDCTAGDTAMLLGVYGNPFHLNTKALWRMPNPAGKWDTLKVTEMASQSGRDTLAFPCTLPGNPSVEFLVKDVTGAVAIDRFKFEIKPKP